MGELVLQVEELRQKKIPQAQWNWADEASDWATQTMITWMRHKNDQPNGEVDKKYVDDLGKSKKVGQVLLRTVGDEKTRKSSQRALKFLEG